MSAFDETFGEDYNYHMDDVPGLLDSVMNAFTFRRDISAPARSVLMRIAHDFRKENPKKFKKKKDITFVGIHQRRGDHVSYRDEANIRELGASYFLESMEMYREKFKRVVFVYVSDDLDWGIEKLKKRIKTKDLFIAGSLQDPALKGEYLKQSLLVTVFKYFLFFRATILISCSGSFIAFSMQSHHFISWNIQFLGWIPGW